MNKLFIHGFLGLLVLGLVIFQGIGDNTSLMSNAFSGMKKQEICTKPASFSSPEESAWCTRGFVKNIEENRHTWGWSCLVNETEYRCHFTEDISYSDTEPRTFQGL